MGCSTLNVGEAGEDVEIREWALEDPDGTDLDQVREIRDEIEQRVSELFDEVSEHHLTSMG
jgi:arsenate reductase